VPHPELIAALALVGAAACWLLLAAPEIPGTMRQGRVLVRAALGLDRARSELVQAELGWISPWVWVGLRILVAVAAGAAGYALFGLWVLAATAAVAGYRLMGAALAAWCRRVTARRQQAMLEALRHGVSVMSTFGSSVQALRALADGGSPATQAIFRDLLADVDSDSPNALLASVERARERLRDPIWDDIATALSLHWSRGGKLVPALKAVADDWQETLRLRREAKALRAGVEASVAILTVLPFALLLVIHLEAPALLQPLATLFGEVVVATVVGWMMVGYQVLHRVAEPPAMQANTEV
jgi:Flp pilus assembly protein TadB